MVQSLLATQVQNLGYKSTTKCDTDWNQPSDLTQRIYMRFYGQNPRTTYSKSYTHCASTNTTHKTNNTSHVKSTLEKQIYKFLVNIKPILSQRIHMHRERNLVILTQHILWLENYTFDKCLSKIYGPLARKHHVSSGLLQTPYGSLWSYELKVDIE
jgi:hypothetical protein